MPLGNINAAQPIAAISPGYNENSAGERTGFYLPGGPPCVNTFSVPANTPVSIFVNFEEIPDQASSNACTNSKLVITGASTAADRVVTTCNTRDNGGLISFAGETSAYTMTISFTPSALESNGRGYLLLLSNCKKKGFINYHYISVQYHLFFKLMQQLHLRLEPLLTFLQQPAPIQPGLGQASSIRQPWL